MMKKIYFKNVDYDVHYHSTKSQIKFYLCMEKKDKLYYGGKWNQIGIGGKRYANDANDTPPYMHI
jgi:hypothetical protein